MSCGAQRPAGADLGRLLAEQAGPDAQLALALQRGRLGVELADHHQVAVEPAVLLVGEVDRVRRCRPAVVTLSIRSPSGVSSCTSSGSPAARFLERGAARLPRVADPGVALCHPCLPVVSASAPGVDPAAQLVRLPGCCRAGSWRPRLAPVGVAARREPDSRPNPVRERRRRTAPAARVRGGHGCVAVVLHIRRAGERAHSTPAPHSERLRFAAVCLHRAVARPTGRSGDDSSPFGQCCVSTRGGD